MVNIQKIPERNDGKWIRTQAEDTRKRGREHAAENRAVLEDVGQSRGEEGI